jgi:hypothetical protein
MTPPEAPAVQKVEGLNAEMRRLLQTTANTIAAQMPGVVESKRDGQWFRLWRNINEALAKADAILGVEGGKFTPIPLADEAVRYVARYGGRCRDCADESGVCPHSGLPCEGADKAIRHVIKALNYGFSHGYLAAAPALPTVEGGSSRASPSAHPADAAATEAGQRSEGGE